LFSIGRPSLNSATILLIWGTEFPRINLSPLVCFPQPERHPCLFLCRPRSTAPETTV
jgi:hypothetical protein